jgi:dTDP-4-dehydrorhamnose 3,5-epimerase
MLFKETCLAGAFIVDLELYEDSRGFFARSFCIKEFEQHGLNFSIVQCNLSFNRKKGTLRGIHFQQLPTQETKFVRCISGAILDVIVDLRPGSPTYLSHFAVELSAENRKSLYVPIQFGHGFQTLVDNTEVMYQMGDYYTPEGAAGYRFDDPALKIEWPLPISEISDKDLSWPALNS